jgi:hypothetical protein
MGKVKGKEIFSFISWLLHGRFFGDAKKGNKNKAYI